MSFRKKITAKAWKSVIAVLVCIAISWALQRKSPFYAVLAVLICMRADNSATTRACMNRLIATATAMLLSFFVWGILLAIPMQGYLRYVVFLPPTLIAADYICSLTGRTDAYTSCSLILCVLIITHSESFSELLSYFSARLIDTYLGLTAALATNYLPFGKKEKAFPITAELPAIWAAYKTKRSKGGENL